MAAFGTLQCSSCKYTATDLQLFLCHPCNIDTSSAPTDDMLLPVHAAPEIETSSSFRWDDSNTTLLIHSYSEHKQLFKKGKMTKKQVFDKVAAYFNSNLVEGETVSGEQCQRKWNKLIQKYKDVEDNNRKTGHARKDWKFLDAMAECMGDNPKINPGYTFDTSSSCSSVPSTDVGESSGESDNETKGGKTLKNPRKRKHKNYSSASEMLSFLKEYTAKKEKSDETKVELLREMHNEKKQFFTQFLEVLKKK